MIYMLCTVSSYCKMKDMKSFIPRRPFFLPKNISIIFLFAALTGAIELIDGETLQASVLGFRAALEALTRI